jgi:clorobiocin biosynthesis protein Clo-hal
MPESSYDVAIIGGGPAGSACGTLLARDGWKVLLLERHKFPRFHIGESITGWANDALKQLGVFDRLAEINEVQKRGLEFVLHGKSRRVFFPDHHPHPDGRRPWAFQMPRAKLDQVLLERARETGVEVLEQHHVQRVLFDGERATGVEFRSLESGETRVARARWIVDASGQAGVLNRQLKDNVHDDVLLGKKVAVFCHMKGDLGFTNAEDVLNFKLCIHRNGRDWAWFLPVGRDLVSLGVVLSRESVKERQGSLEELFHESARDIAFIAEFVQKPGLELEGKFRSVVDYSYRCRRYHGPGWVLAGDSAGFIDPLFSTGLQIVLNSVTKLAPILSRVLGGSTAEDVELERYDRDLQRFFRLSSTLTHLFYLCRMNPDNYESGWYLWRNIPFAGLGYRLRYLYHGARVMFARPRTARIWGEEVLFGNPSPGNRIADLYMVLAENFEKYHADRIRTAAPRERFIEQEA